MADENRTDLPHDQVAQDNDGQITEENNVNEAPLSLGIDERATGAVTPVGEEDIAPGFTPLTGEADTAVDVAPELERQNNDEEAAIEIGPEIEFGGRDEETGAEIAPELERNDVETAAEIAPPGRPYAPDTNPEEERPVGNRELMNNVEEMEREEAGGTALGWTALVLSIISLFFMPLLTASIGVIAGFFAYRNGARTLGMWAIAIGLFSIVLGLFFVPLVR